MPHCVCPSILDWPLRTKTDTVGSGSGSGSDALVAVGDPSGLDEEGSPPQESRQKAEVSESKDMNLALFMGIDLFRLILRPIWPFDMTVLRFGSAKDKEKRRRGRAVSVIIQVVFDLRWSFGNVGSRFAYGIRLPCAWP